MKPSLVVEPGVADALARGDPVVALESTIIAHGLPYPANVETARQVEAAVRANGAVPATVAVLGGRIRIGLDDGDLEHLGRSGGVSKLSRRDLAVAVARGLDGATTVAATMIVASLVGVRVFVTGGIGGVHRGAAATFDISADLTELARTRVAVVCAGAKSILDLGLTLEVLETCGVPVIGYRTDRFPAFFIRDSGYGVDARVDAAADLARIVRSHWDLGLESGLVIGNPIPHDAEMDPELIERAIRGALDDALEQGIAGRALTPFLLSRIESLTNGESLASNRALVTSNASVGARLAVEMARL